MIFKKVNLMVNQVHMKWLNSLYEIFNDLIKTLN